MKRLILSAGALALPFLAPTTFAATPPAMDDAARQSYALGYQLGRDLAGTEVRNEALIQGLADGRSGAATKLTPEEMQAALASLEKGITAQRAKQQAAAAEKAAAAGTAYLAENAKREGVKTTVPIPTIALSVRTLSIPLSRHKAMPPWAMSDHISLCGRFGISTTSHQTRCSNLN